MVLKHAYNTVSGAIIKYIIQWAIYKLNAFIQHKLHAVHTYIVFLWKQQATRVITPPMMQIQQHIIVNISYAVVAVLLNKEISAHKGWHMEPQNTPNLSGHFTRGALDNEISSLSLKLAQFNSALLRNASIILHSARHLLSLTSIQSAVKDGRVSLLLYDVMMSQNKDNVLALH